MRAGTRSIGVLAASALVAIYGFAQSLPAEQTVDLKAGYEIQSNRL